MITTRFTLDDIDLCADTVALLGADQPRTVWASLAWVIRNRAQHAAGLLGKSPEIGSACEEVLSEALEAPKLRSGSGGLSGADWCRLRAVNHLVWAGDLGDDTGGALACHRHDRNPLWARRRTPTALLGSFLFFR
jgi:hypothetical protein